MLRTATPFPAPRRLRGVAAAAHLLLAAMACGGASSPRGAAPERAGPASASSVISWALGSGARGNYPASADAFLLLLPRGKPLQSAARVSSACVRATSILPAPPGDPRIFLVVDGALHFLRAPGAQPEAALGNDPALRLTRLLAFRAEASPVQILAAALPRGASEEQIWSITVSDAAILRAQPAGDELALASQEAFFAAYTTPRCQAGGRDCLRFEDDERQTYIAVRPAPDAPLREVQALASTDVRDIAWGPGEEASFYLLVGGCT
ncbi:hypothetical protein [Sorangium sp. So ce1078]|uniref:hypothetical protein n=1 Tax=Sorangium sp. So ce1078 TaxID=3133329 RepID=UPI003F6245B3